MIKTNQVGKILKGYMAGWYIYIQPLTDGEEGFLMLYLNMNNFNRDGSVRDSEGLQGKDIWFQFWDNVVSAVEDQQLVIEWLE